MMIINKWIISGFLTIILAWNLRAQPINFAQKVDSIFMSWNVPGHPGGAVGIMKDGQVLYAKGFGLASLEYQIPNDFATRFNIASVSKQFTAFGILLMQEQGLLSLDDPVQKHLPELPTFEHPVTIRHMLHHTSGLRSLHALLTMAGWRSDDRRTNDDLLRLMIRQKELNFDPGAEYLYCNTGYILSAMIIERISGLTFRDWMNKHVFEPLNMHNTYVEDKVDRVNKHLANSYYLDWQEGSWSMAVPYWGYTGSGNIHTNVPDLLRWLQNLEDPVIGNPDMIQQMLTPGILNNGDTIDYALGITVNTYKGIAKYGHGGSIGGYRSGTETLPDHDIQIVILTNFNLAGVNGKINRIIDIMLGLPPLKPETINNRTAPEFMQIPASLLQESTGEYYSPELMTSYWIIREEDQLFALHPRHDKGKMSYLGDDKFDTHLPWGTVQLVRANNNQIKGLRATNGRVRNLWFEKVR